ncbi:MAG: MFS transporter [Pseudomonadota bacterium]
MNTETAPEVPLRPLTSVQQAMIALAMVAMGAGMMINFVVVAPLAREAGLSEIEVAGILTLSAAIYALMIPRWGEWANQYGRKRIMVFSLAAMGLTNMAFLLALDAALAGVLTGSTMFFTLVFVRVWFGLLSPGLQPASMAAMTDATTATTRASGLGMIGAAMSFGSILGPASAALLAEFGALVPLWGTIIFNLFCAVVLAFVLPPTQKRERTSQRPKPLAIRDPRVFPHLLFLFIYFVGVGMIQQTLGWFLEDRYSLGREDAVRYAGIAFSCLAVMMIVVQFGYIQPRKPDPRRMLPIGLALVGIGYICADVFHPFWAVSISFLIVGIGAALTVPSANALGSLSVARQEQGSAAALLSMAPPSGFVFGPLIGAALYQLAPALPMILSATLMIVLAAYAYFVTARRPLTPN